MSTLTPFDAAQKAQELVKALLQNSRASSSEDTFALGPRDGGLTYNGEDGEDLDAVVKRFITLYDHQSYTRVTRSATGNQHEDSLRAQKHMATSFVLITTGRAREVAEMSLK